MAGVGQKRNRARPSTRGVKHAEVSIENIGAPRVPAKSMGRRRRSASQVARSSTTDAKGAKRMNAPCGLNGVGDATHAIANGDPWAWASPVRTVTCPAAKNPRASHGSAVGRGNGYARSASGDGDGFGKS